MLIAILALVTALAISSVAIYYSVAGLVAIFAAAAIPIIIMGGVLEIGKLVTAVWLHRNWHIATWWLKTYLSTAVLVLMFITSMGIFGFLSKAHIEQTAGAQQDVAKIEQYEEKIEYNQSVIQSAEEKINELQDSGSSVESSIRRQISQEQERIDTAYDRVKPAIQEQRDIIANQTQGFKDRVESINEDIERLERYIENDEIAKMQAIIGVNVDGSYGPNTAQAFREWRQEQQDKRDELQAKIESASQNSQVVADARNEIDKLQRRAERQIANSNETIDKLRARLDNSTSTNVENLIEEQNTRIQAASSEVEVLNEKRFELETNRRALEAEVGPLRYIAEFVYGEEANGDLLEKAVQWIIIIIIFVFDPLAVLLLIASQYTFEHARKQRNDDIKQTAKLLTPESEDEDSDNQVDDVSVRTDDYDDNDSVHDNVDSDDVTIREEASSDPDKSIEAPELEYVRENWDTGSSEKLEVSEEFKNEREALYNEKEQDEEFVNKKTEWKADNPDETLKHYKKLYVHGVIDSLPWE